MALLVSLLVGVLFGTGVYMVMRRTMVRMLIGLSLLGNGASLLVFAGFGLVRARPPLVPPGAVAPVRPFADPLAQALVLTAIVISFGVIAFTLSLTTRVHRETGSENLSDLRSHDR